MLLYGVCGEFGVLSFSVEVENWVEVNCFMELVLLILWMFKDYVLQSGVGLVFEYLVSKLVVLISWEKEVLQWCVIGKISWEILVICNCLEVNVNFYMGNIWWKFGVIFCCVVVIMVVNLGFIIF